MVVEEGVAVVVGEKVVAIGGPAEAAVDDCSLSGSLSLFLSQLRWPLAPALTRADLGAIGLSLLVTRISRGG